MLSVTLRQLEVFRNVVDTGSFSAAATVLGISQPSVSMHIRALETHLREPVFERQRGQAPALTDIGRRVYDHAGDILTQSDRALVDIRALQSVRDNVLSFAAHRFIGNHLLSKPLASFARDNPGIEIIANIGALDQAVEKIRQRDVDLGLFLGHGEVKGIRSEILGCQRLAFIAAADHPLASRRRLSYRDLANHPFIGPVKGTQYADLLRSVFDEVGFTEHNTITQSQNTLIRRELILSGVGFSCALKSGWTDDLDSGQLVILDVVGDPLSLEVRIGSLSDRKISDASHKFVAYLNILKEAGTFDS
ncbi:MAG: LysR family transcriptional regulator [Rhodospirillaceae bacterium]|nr:LysR family transcriptional regulator [Rhodospirillaceae bacterium]MBT5456150.1 LysR family transcriptional regulator [Rhodospirillaceae bacterium]